MKKLISMVLAMLALASCGEAEPEPIPNEHFATEYETFVTLGETEGDSDLVTFTSAETDFLNYSSRGYRIELKLNAEIAPPPYAQLPPSLSYSYFVEYGTVETLGNDGEWEYASDLEVYSSRRTFGEGGAVFLNNYYSLTLYCHFPITEAGEYRVTVCFSDDPASVDEPQMHSVSTVVTVSASEKKFDLISVAHDRFIFPQNGITALLFRSNDGVIPYQDLAATKLEKSVRGEWVEQPGMVGLLVDEDGGSNDYIAPSGFAAAHPFTGEELGGLFCGTAALHPDDKTASYRLTLEFTENADGSGERYVFQIPIALPVP